MLQLRSALLPRLIPALLLIGALSCNGASPTAPSGSQSPPTTSPGPGGSASPTLAALTLAETEVDGGDSVTGTATLSAAAPSGGTVVTLTSSDEVAGVPASITIAAGATSGTFAVMTETVPFDVDVTITGAAGGASRTATLSIEPAPGDGPIQSAGVQSDDVIGGDDTPGTITLSAPAPAGGAHLALSSSDTDVIVPSSVTVPAGSTSATFPIETRPVSVAKTVGVTVTLAPAAGLKTAGTTAAGASSYTFLIELLPGAPDTPTLTAVSPSSGVQGSTVAVTLTGTNFVDGATVAVSGEGVTVSDVVIASATSITATLTIDAGAAAGARNVTVTTAGGTTGAQSFTITELPPSAPTLTSLSPSIGVEAAVVTVTLTGTNFIDGATVAVSDPSVTVSDVVVVGPTSITATFTVDDCADPGARTVTVTTAGGTSGEQTFTVVGPPTLTGITPSIGERASTVSVTLTGANFIEGAAVSVSGDGVTVNDVTVVSSTSITADFVIEGTTDLGERDVTVTTVAGTSGAQGFVIQQPSGDMTFNYTGASQTFVVPEGVTSIEIEASGAQGGGGGGPTTSAGGLGGRVTATISVTPGETLTIVVGGAGGDVGACEGPSGSGGFNGGGAGGSNPCRGGGGGGASDVRRGGTGLDDRVVVAGGGGGGGGYFGSVGGAGGAGGGETGGAGADGTAGFHGDGGGGGSQSTGGAAGAGNQNGTAGASGEGGAGASGQASGGGGGGGFFGGGGGGGGSDPGGGLIEPASAGGGGGGSSFALETANDVTHEQDVRSGDGIVIIRWYAPAPR